MYDSPVATVASALLSETVVSAVTVKSFKMEWNNESVFEFIELVQGEPCIWNPKNRDHKNKNMITDAWVRINNIFSVPCSIEKLKKKRNTLLNSLYVYHVKYTTLKIGILE